MQTNPRWITAAEYAEREEGQSRRLGPFKFGAFDAQALLNTGQPTIDGGTFTISCAGQTTDPIQWNFTNDQLIAALEALSTIGAGNVYRVNEGAGDIDINFGGPIQFRGNVVHELLTLDATNLTGPDAPYTIQIGGQDHWTTEPLFTPNIGDTILDFQIAVIVNFTSELGDPAEFGFGDNQDSPLDDRSGKWSTYGHSDPTPMLLTYQDTDFTNFLGNGSTDIGNQRSVRELQLAYSTPGTSVKTTVPIIVVNSVPIYGGFNALGQLPEQGEVWVWADIAEGITE